MKHKTTIFLHRLHRLWRVMLGGVWEYQSGLGWYRYDLGDQPRPRSVVAVEDNGIACSNFLICVTFVLFLASVIALIVLIGSKP